MYILKKENNCLISLIMCKLENWKKVFFLMKFTLNKTKHFHIPVIYKFFYESEDKRNSNLF